MTTRLQGKIITVRIEFCYPDWDCAPCDRSWKTRSSCHPPVPRKSRTRRWTAKGPMSQTRAKVISGSCTQQLALESGGSVGCRWRIPWMSWWRRTHFFENRQIWGMGNIVGNRWERADRPETGVEVTCRLNTENQYLRGWARYCAARVWFSHLPVH